MKIVHIRFILLVGFLCCVCRLSLGQVTFFAGTGHNYELVVNPGVSWTGAYNSAVSRSFNGHSGHLATITSQGENNFVMTLIGVGPVWIGGVQAAGSVEPAGGWGWVTGESWSYTNWGPGEPNNDGGPFGNEDKLAFGNTTPGYSGWGDLPDNGGFAAMRGFVVEYDVVPEPSIGICFAFAFGAIIDVRKKGRLHRVIGDAGCR